ncbi:unnamed protein product [Arctia plantaginis]|uniref:C3H1-type domain-containing protein n=1 Tax=Arctia plantaginis TaxID=874455 RepID=A0A8S0ZL34_ARCPL|nr:unnamed protein product [Arctia plantaginis]
MLIENPDAFKSWLTSILEPLCDADPAALAKYVYALVKKDKPVEELREVMVDQLDVFLQHETKPFVEMLFTSLESNEYLKHVVENEVSPPGVEEPPKEQPAVVENHVGEAPAATTSVPGPSGPRSGGESRARSPTAGAVAGSIGPPRLVVSRAARHAAPAPLNRHPHNEHTLVKVLPLTELLEEPVDQPPRRRDRRGDSTRDKDDRRRRRSRSWERRARARRHVRDSEHNNDVRRRLPSRSPSPRGRYRNRSPPPPALERQTSRSRSRSPVIRERDLERERDRLRVPREMERDRMSRDREHRDRISSSRDRERSRDRSRDRSTSPHDTDRRLDHNDAYKRRCRDFDEKGYCMRGDLCQWDHGSDPVVLEDAAAALSSVLALPPAVPEYNPLTPDIWCGGAGSFPPYAHPHHPHPPRELIPIPSSVPHRIRHDMSTVGPRPAPPPQPRHPAPHKKTFDYNRFGCARPPLASGSANCSLDVKKVPRGLNDITHLNNHFSKFGKIVNIQVCYEGDPEAALITFSNPTEANIAYKSTEAVLNNRFIKVFWHNPHNPDNKQENMAPGGQHVNKPNDRQNSQHPMSHNKVLINRDNIKATADNKQQQEKEKEAENGVEPKKEAVKPVTKSKLIMDQHKRAQALLETQLQQQMLLIQKLESGNVTEAQRPALLEAISSAQEGIENLRKQLMAYNDTVKQLQDESVARTMSRLHLAQVQYGARMDDSQKYETRYKEKLVLGESSHVNYEPFVFQFFTV